MRLACLGSPNGQQINHFSRKAGDSWSAPLTGAVCIDNINWNFYQVFGEIEFSPAVVKKTLMDIEYRKKWDSYVAKIEMLESNNNTDIIYWDVKYGIPMVSNRDYIYCREFKGSLNWQFPF